MYKGKIDKLINEINKIARLKRISYKLENIYEEYDVFDFNIILKLRFNKTYHIIGLRLPVQILENEIASFQMCDNLITKEIMKRYLKEE